MTAKKKKFPSAPPVQPVVLALETSTRVCGLALLQGGETMFSLSFVPPGGHSGFLMTAVDDAVALTGLQPALWNAVVVSRGPGSFTGLRIGLATAKGLALGLGIPLFGVPTLEVLARGAAAAAERFICPVMDARKGQVFTALYRRTRQGVKEVRPPASLLPEELPSLAPPDALFTGDALGIYADRIGAAYGSARLAFAGPELWHPDAVVVGRMGMTRVLAGDPSELVDLVPLYVRPSDAELNRHDRHRPARRA